MIKRQIERLAHADKDQQQCEVVHARGNDLGGIDGRRARIVAEPAAEPGIQWRAADKAARQVAQQDGDEPAHEKYDDRCDDVRDVRDQRVDDSGKPFHRLPPRLGHHGGSMAAAAPPSTVTTQRVPTNFRDHLLAERHDADPLFCLPRQLIREHAPDNPSQTQVLLTARPRV